MTPWNTKWKNFYARQFPYRTVAVLVVEDGKMSFVNSKPLNAFLRNSSREVNSKEEI